MGVGMMNHHVHGKAFLLHLSSSVIVGFVPTIELAIGSMPAVGGSVNWSGAGNDRRHGGGGIHITLRRGGFWPGSR